MKEAAMQYDWHVYQWAWWRLYQECQAIAFGEWGSIVVTPLDDLPHPGDPF
jgi:hypothetical protein